MDEEKIYYFVAGVVDDLRNGHLPAKTHQRFPQCERSLVFRHEPRDKLRLFDKII
jgi:hypothetical protein